MSTKGGALYSVNYTMNTHTRAHTHYFNVVFSKIFFDLVTLL